MLLVLQSRLTRLVLSQKYDAEREGEYLQLRGKDLSIPAIADVVSLAGIHLQSLGKIERGRTLKLNHKTARGLAYALNIPKEYLEAVGRGVVVDIPSALKFCPSCWTVGMAPESMWLDLRAKFCRKGAYASNPIIGFMENQLFKDEN